MVKVIISAINVATHDRLFIVKQGNYTASKSSISKAIVDGYEDKYKKAAPRFEVMDVIPQTDIKNGEHRYIVAFKDKFGLFRRTRALYTADVTFKEV